MVQPRMSKLGCTHETSPSFPVSLVKVALKPVARWRSGRLGREGGESAAEVISALRARALPEPDYAAGPDGKNQEKDRYSTTREQLPETLARAWGRAPKQKEMA